LIDFSTSLRDFSKTEKIIILRIRKIKTKKELISLIAKKIKNPKLEKILVLKLMDVNF